MNAKKLIVALSLLAAGSAFADDINYPYVKFDDFQSTKTRAQVLAELQDAQRDGTYVVGGEAWAGQYPAVNARTSLAGKASNGTAGD